MPVLYGVFLFMGVAALSGIEVSVIHNVSNTMHGERSMWLNFSERDAKHINKKQIEQDIDI